RHRVAAGRLAVEALIGEVREVDRAGGDGKGGAAVLVHAGADVERRWRHVFETAVGRAPHDDAAAAFGGAHFGPIHVVAVEDDVLEAQALAGDHLSSDGRLPGTVWCDLGSKAAGRGAVHIPALLTAKGTEAQDATSRGR